MGYVLTDEQKDLKSMVANFMSKEVKPHLAAIDESGEFPIDIYKQAFDIGLHMLEIPEQSAEVVSTIKLSAYFLKKWDIMIPALQ